MSADMITNPTVPVHDDGNVLVDCTNPIDVLTPEFKRRMDDYMRNANEILATGVKDPTDETDMRPAQGQTLSEVQTAAAMALIDGSKHMPCACGGIRAVFGFLSGPEGIFGDAEGHRAVRRVVVLEPFAPDFSSGCQSVGYFMSICELLGMSSLHGMTHMAFLSILDAMVKSEEIYVNLFLEGGAATGKSFVIKLVKTMAIDGTFVEEQHQTDKSAYDESGSRICEIHCRNEFQPGLVCSSGGFDKKGDRAGERGGVRAGIPQGQRRSP